LIPESPEQHRLADLVLRALVREQPSAMSTLRQTAPTLNSVRDWTRVWHIECPVLIWLCWTKRMSWESHPDHQGELGDFAPIWEPPPAYIAWLQHGGYLAPNPRFENLREDWRARADALYHEAEQLPGMQKPAPWPHMPDHARWFVLRQLRGLSYERLAETVDVDKSEHVRIAVHRVGRTLNCRVRSIRRSRRSSDVLPVLSSVSV
jgi:hypothetical protein